MSFKRVLLFIICTVALFTSSAQAQEKETMVLIKTTLGDITVKLYNETPIHRDNFIKQVQEQTYDSLLFHRCIRDFMIQGGDPDSKTAVRHQQLGQGDLGYTLPAEFVYPKYFHKYGALCAARQGDKANPDRRSSACQFYIVTGKTYRSYELKDLEETLGKNRRQSTFDRLCAKEWDLITQLSNDNDNEGMKALQERLAAKADSILAAQGPFKFSDEQFDTYLSKGGTPHLDNEYTVFGEVVDGMNIVDKISRVAVDIHDRPLRDIRIISATIIN